MLLERNKNCNGALGNKENVEKINKIYLKINAEAFSSL